MSGPVSLVSRRTAMPDREACRGRDSNFRCKLSSSEAHEQEVRHDVCFQCNAGKRPATRSPSPQRRPPVQRAQNCFGDDACAVSHRQVGRGRAPEGTSWTGSQHEFDNPTSADATASPRGETAAAANTTGVRRGSKRLAVFGWLSCIRDTTLLVNGKCISDQYHEDECRDAASVAASYANCAVTRKTMVRALDKSEEPQFEVMSPRVTCTRTRSQLNITVCIAMRPCLGGACICRALLRAERSCISVSIPMARGRAVHL